MGAEANSGPTAQGSPSPAPSADPCAGAGRLLATANRPTVGFSACAVAKGTAVFELGYQNQVNGTSRAGSVVTQVPQAFVRLGIAQRFEVDAIGPDAETIRTFAPGHPSATVHGLADSGIGFKYELAPSGRWLVAFDGLYTPPNGAAGVTAGGATTQANLDASYALSPSTSVGTTVAMSSTGQNDALGVHAGYGVTTPSFVLTTQLPRFYQLYAEYVYSSKIAPAQGGRAFFDAGIQKLLGRRVEMDVEYGHAVTAIRAQKFDYVGSGLVLQFW